MPIIHENCPKVGDCALPSIGQEADWDGVGEGGFCNLGESWEREWEVADLSCHYFGVLKHSVN